MESQQQLKSMTREISALSAALHRETKRRASLSAHQQQLMQQLADAENEAKSLVYANRKLEEELERTRDDAERSIKPLRKRVKELEYTVSSRLSAATTHFTSAHTAAITLKAAIASSKDFTHPAALQSGIERIEEAALAMESALHTLGTIIQHNASSPITSPSHPSNNCGLPPGQQGEVAQLRAQVHRLHLELETANRNNGNNNQLQQDPSSSTTSSKPHINGITGNVLNVSNPPVDVAVRELQAIVPQYRAAANALQGHASVLKAQLSEAVKERDELLSEATTWRQAAEKHESLFATTAAKLHAQEAKSMAETAALQEQCDGLTAQLHEAEKQCAAAERAAADAEHRMKFLQTELRDKERVCAAQEETIVQLEGTVKEQQEDIVAALNLAAGRPTEGSHALKTAKERGFSSYGTAPRKGPSNVGLMEAGVEERQQHGGSDGQHWRIGAGGGGQRAQVGVEGDRDIGAEILSLKDALRQALHELKE